GNVGQVNGPKRLRSLFLRCLGWIQGVGNRHRQRSRQGQNAYSDFRNAFHKNLCQSYFLWIITGVSPHGLPGQPTAALTTAAIQAPRGSDMDQPPPLFAEFPLLLKIVGSAQGPE